MKKFLIGLFLIFVSTSANAGVIALNTISNDSTANTFNANFTTLSNFANGQVQGSATTGSSTNILAGSIGYLDMGSEANPVTRDSELLGITSDTTTSQNSYVYTGLSPATSASLTSTITAGTAYVNGYRVAKTATSETYTASMDTYVDLSQTGAYTLSAVTVGATAPSVAANSARIAKVTTSGTAITSVTDLANRRIPGLIVPTNYRVGMIVSWDSTSTLKVMPGILEVNGTIISKTAATTLTLGTAGDWAGGSSLQAVSTYGYVGSDASGNLKMHTTAPSNTNYGLTTTLGKKRYASWSSTTYRVIGWFYMNATGSGQLNSYEVGNIKEGDVPNFTANNSNAQFSSASTTFVSDTSALSHFYDSGNPTLFTYSPSLGNSGTSSTYATVSLDSAGISNNIGEAFGNSSLVALTPVTILHPSSTISQGTHTVQGQIRVSGSTGAVNSRNLICEEE